MTPLIIVAILFIITAILHVATLIRFGSNSKTIPVAIYGGIYLILGVLILLNIGAWTPTIALGLTLFGGIAATVQINANPEMRTWTVGFIAIDVVIILLLVVNFWSMQS